MTVHMEIHLIYNANHSPTVLHEQVKDLSDADLEYKAAISVHNFEPYLRAIVYFNDQPVQQSLDRSDAQGIEDYTIPEKLQSFEMALNPDLKEM